MSLTDESVCAEMVACRRRRGSRMGWSFVASDRAFFPVLSKQETKPNRDKHLDRSQLTSELEVQFLSACTDAAISIITFRYTSFLGHPYFDPYASTGQPSSRPSLPLTNSISNHPSHSPPKHTPLHNTHLTRTDLADPCLRCTSPLYYIHRPDPPISNPYRSRCYYKAALCVALHLYRPYTRSTLANAGLILPSSFATGTCESLCLRSRDCGLNPFAWVQE